MKKDLLAQLSERILLMDGGMGTMLIAAGLTEDDVPELWNIEHPDRIKQIHSAYYSAGSDIVQTNTFGGSKLKLEKKGLGDRAYEANRAAVQLALEICPEDKYLAGDIGPLGEFLQPSGTYTEEDFIAVFKEQAEALLEGGVHLFSIETMMDIREAVAALKAVKMVSDLPVFVELVFNETPRGFFTLMGNSVEKCIKELDDNGADVVGSNCNLKSELMVKLAGEIRKNTSLPVIIQPNAGQPQLKDGQVIYEQSIYDYLADIHKIIDEGVNIIGGCCGTNPEYIQGIYKIIK
ncbi:homocysteine S-methyltransferase family protein [candidate division KSB1 bacterium]